MHRRFRQRDSEQSFRDRAPANTTQTQRYKTKSFSGSSSPLFLLLSLFFFVPRSSSLFFFLLLLAYLASFFLLASSCSFLSSFAFSLPVDSFGVQSLFCLPRLRSGPRLQSRSRYHQNRFSENSEPLPLLLDSRECQTNAEQARKKEKERNKNFSFTFFSIVCFIFTLSMESCEDGSCDDSS